MHGITRKLKATENIYKNATNFNFHMKNKIEDDVSKVFEIVPLKQIKILEWHSIFLNIRTLDILTTVCLSIPETRDTP